jgi:phosphate-selective porin OprO/OprP
MQNRNTWLLLLIILSFILVAPLVASAELADILYEKGLLSKEDYIKSQAETEKLAEAEERRLEEEFPVKLGYGSKGFEISTRDGKYSTQIQWRLQFRWGDPTTGDPSQGEFLGSNVVEDAPASTFQVRRARIKVGGHGYKPWLKYYFEYDWPSAHLLDWRLMIEKYQWAQLRLGQWKINYNRERVDSSGKQFAVERSIVNPTFTIDRQQGAMAYGHLFRGTMADSWYYAFVGNGTGRGQLNDDGRMMWMGRAQWNFLGRDLKFSQTDVEFHEKPTGSVSFAGYWNQSRCTRFSSSGCSNLNRFNQNGDSTGRYKLLGMQQGFAFKYRGWDIQQEYHWKQVDDEQFPNGCEDPFNGTPTSGQSGCQGPRTNLMGSYVQSGFFPHHWISKSIPQELHMGFRYAFVDPNISQPFDLTQEYTFVINYFFAGHRNKLTFDTSRLTQESQQPDGTGKLSNVQRFRLQWDISF